MQHRAAEKAGRAHYSRAGQIIDRGEKCWLVRVFLGRDPKSGTRRYLAKTVHGNRKDAQAVLTELLRKRDRGGLGLQSRESLDAFLDYWLDTVKRHQVEPQTLALYRDYLARYIRPELGHIPLCDVRVGHLQDHAAALRDRGLSRRTAQLAFVPLSDALNRAVIEQRIDLNPARLLDMRGKPSPRRAAALEAPQVKKFIELAEPGRRTACLVFMVATGMRPGELAALRWLDIDVDARVASVSRAIARVRGQKGWRVKEPKSVAGRRVVVLDETALRVLRQQRRWQAEDRLAAGPAWQDLDLVFASEIGTPINVNNLAARHFKKILAAAGIPTTFRIYDLRHTYGTRMIEQGTDAKTVAELMGHSNVALTLGLYTHPNLEMKRKAVARLEETLTGRR